MKFVGGAIVMVPWIGVDEDGVTNRNWSRLSFKTTEHGASVDKRRIKREIRKFIAGTIQRSVHISELQHILRFIVPMGDFPRRTKSKYSFVGNAR